MSRPFSVRCRTDTSAKRSVAAPEAVAKAVTDAVAAKLATIDLKVTTADK